MSKPVTVVIPTFNRRRALLAVFPSYLRQEIVERIIVVDDGSTDGTTEAIHATAATSSVPVQVIRHATRRGQPAARLSGIAAAESDWVLFGEDDVWLTPEYTRTLLREAGELGASVIAGRLLVARIPGDFSEDVLPEPGSATSRSDQVFDVRNLEANYSASVAGPVPAPYLHSIALIRRPVFTRVTFDTWYAGNSWREETDFYISVNSAGLGVYFTPGAVCYHLRGPICAGGGQRINRLLLEYLAWRNTRYLVTKHWDFLSEKHGLRGSALSWMIGFFVRRQIGQLRRALTSGIRSTYRG